MNGRSWTAGRVAVFGILAMRFLMVGYLAAGQSTTPSVIKKSQPLKCDVQLDSKKPKTIVIILDLTSLDVTKSVSDFQVSVQFIDQNGKTLGKRQFKFVDPNAHEASLQGGQKYSRRFEYDDKAFPLVAAVKAVPLPAQIVTQVDAFGNSTR